MMKSIDEELLTPRGMAEAYAEITKKYPWFLHVKPVRKFDSIKEFGLQPRRQGCPSNTAVASAIGDLVNDHNEVIFLRPIETFDSTPYRGEPRFMLAVASEFLPKIITVDWTFDGTWGLASIIKKGEPALTDSAIFCEVVRRRGSIAIYEAVPPTALRVQTKGTLVENPSSWPPLVDTAMADVMVF